MHFATNKISAKTFMLLSGLSIIAGCDSDDSSSNTGDKAPVTSDAPVITQVPDSLTIEATGPDGVAIDSQKVTDMLDAIKVTDDVDQGLSFTHNVPNPIPLGTTTVTISATDSDENTHSVSVDLIVVDTTPPILTLNGDNPMTVQWSTDFTNPGAKAQDIVDGNLDAAVTVAGSVDTSTPGSYELTYSVSDSRGNQAENKTRTVNVVVPTTVAPTINIPAPTKFEAEGPEGVPVTSAALTSFINSVTATDDIDPEIEVSHNLTGSLPLGTTEVTFTAVDSHGNVATDTIELSVVDTTPPAVVLNGDESVRIILGSAFEDHGITALDIVDGDISDNAVRTGELVLTEVGTYSLNYQVTDASGNTSPVLTRTVEIYLPTASVRFIHAIVDAPVLNMQLNDDNQFTNIDYGQASSIEEINTAKYDIDVDAITPVWTSNLYENMISLEGHEFDEDKRYDIIAIGNISDEIGETLLIEAEREFDTTKARVRFVHGAYGAGKNQFEVRVFPVFSDIADTPVLETLGYKMSSETAHLLDSGPANVCLTLDGQTLSPFYCSSTVNLEAGSDHVFVISDNPYDVQGGSDTRSHVILTKASAGESEMLFHANEGYYMNFAHMSQKSPAMDIISALTNDRLVKFLHHLSIIGYQNFHPGRFGATAVTSDEAQTEIVKMMSEQAFQNGQIITTILHKGSESVEAFFLEEKPRKVFYHFKVRLTNILESQEPVDIYITPTMDIAGYSPLVSGLAHKESTDYLNFKEGSYVFTITEHGSQDILRQLGSDGILPRNIVIQGFITDNEGGVDLQLTTIPRLLDK